MLVADTLARVLGIIGTVAGLSGVVAAGVAILSYRRDRPKLVVSCGLSGTGDGLTLDVQVVNDGRYPIAIAGVFIGDGTPWVMGRVEGALKQLRGWVAVTLPLPKRVQRALVEPRLPDDVIEITGLAAPDLNEPVLLGIGKPYLATFAFKKLQLIAGIPVLYVTAVDVLGRATQERVPAFVSQLIHSPQPPEGSSAASR